MEGLYNKYSVSKTDGSEIDPSAEYFVLRIDEHCEDKKHLDACKKALLTYAESIKGHIPKLSEDLIKRYNLCGI
jgi:hypothetical protein